MEYSEVVFIFFLCFFVLVKVCLFGSGFLYSLCVSESLLLCVHYYLILRGVPLAFWCYLIDALFVYEKTKMPI